ncbi:MAG: spore coat associated protein CotJA [Oscillospiraceae bacterium]|nr:spore coat associated protein CotJA [Oscillospiraceae bacterium]
MPCPLCRRGSPQVLAMAYVPMQTWGNLYEPEKALSRATLFVDLDLPYLGRKI